LKFIFKKAPSEFFEESPIVLMGRGHSGTRLLSTICDLLGVSLFANNKSGSGDTSDTKFTKAIISSACDVMGSGNKLEGIDVFKKAVWKYFLLHDGAEKWGWKFPETFLIPEIVHATFPNAKYIHILRDGRDLAFKSHLTDNPLKKLGKLILKKLDTFDKPAHIQAASSWAYQVNNFLSFSDSLPSNQIMHFKFEALCTDPIKISTQIADFLELPMTDDCLNFIKKIDASKIGQYKENDPTKLAEVSQYLQSDLKKLNYL